MEIATVYTLQISFDFKRLPVAGHAVFTVRP